MYSESVKDKFTVLNIPYNSFTYDNTNKFFQTTMPAYTGTVVGFFVRPTNGNAVLGAYLTSQNKVNIMGIIPTTGNPVNGDYQFICNALIRH